MQDLDVKKTIQKIKKTKAEVKKELEESLEKSGRNENADVQEKVNGCKANEDAAKAIQEFEQIIENRKNDIVWLAYYQSQIFQKFREQERFVSSIVLKFRVSKSTIVFKLTLKKLINDFPKIKNSWLSLHYLKKEFKTDQRNMQRKR